MIKINPPRGMDRVHRHRTFIEFYMISDDEGGSRTRLFVNSVRVISSRRSNEDEYTLEKVTKAYAFSRCITSENFHHAGIEITSRCGYVHILDAALKPAKDYFLSNKAK